MNDRCVPATLVLAMGVVLGGAGGAEAAVRCVNRTDPRCTASHPTIQAAVTASAAGDIILVGPGVYNESVTIPAGKNGLSLFGAQAGVDARRATPGPTSIVDASATGTSAIIVLSTDVVIDGFTVQGGTGGNATGIDLKGNGGAFTAADGARVVNNVLRNNSTGVSLNSEGFGPVTNVVLQHNLFTSNNAGTPAVAGDGIFTSACQSVSITENRFTLHQRLAMGINNSSNVTITANESENDARFVVFTGTTSSEFSHNRGRSFAVSSFFSNARAAAVLVGFGNSDLTITHNDLEGGPVGAAIRGIQFGGYGPNPINANLTVSYNRINRLPLHGMVAEANMLTSSIIVGNQSADNGGDGILINTGDSANFLIDNVAVGNAGVDCNDNTTGGGTLGTANVWLENEGGTSSPAGLCAPPPKGDFNANGRSDILWRHQKTGDNLVWFMEGATVTSGAVLMSVGDVNWQIVGTADFNGDGHSDILWRNLATGDNVVWFMRGATVAGGAVLTPLADSNWRIVATGDFNGDRKPDILWRHQISGDNVVWFMNGTVLAGGAVLTPRSDTNWVVGGVGDFSGDANVDILWRNRVTGDDEVWLMSGTTLTSSAVLTAVSDPNWVIGGVGDFNGDANVDIVWRHQATGDNVIWFMSRTTVAGGAVLTAVTDTDWRIVGPR